MTTIKKNLVNDEITMLYEEILLHKAKVVCLTSATSHEGTTTIACALASAAGLQQKVLYCDFTDYHTSLSKKLHIHFQKSNDDPLKQMLANIYPVDKYHFDLMPQDQDLIPTLMLDGFLKNMLSELTHQYDLIIIDTNGFHRYKGTSMPTGIITSVADATILVVLSARVSEIEVKHTVNSIQDGGGVLIGCVMNDIKYPRLVDDMCRATHKLDKFFPRLASQLRHFLKKIVVLKIEV